MHIAAVAYFMASLTGSGRGNSGLILFWSLVLVWLMVLGIGLLVGQAAVGASIGLGLTLIVMVYLREGPARGLLLPWSQCTGARGCAVARLAKAERVVIDALLLLC